MHAVVNRAVTGHMGVIEMKSVLSYFRVPEWYDSKIPLAMAVCLYAMVFEPQTIRKQNMIMWYAAYFVFCVTYFAVNYLINDYSDIEEDRNAGKRKVIQSVDPRMTLFLLIVLPIGSVFELFAASNYSIFTFAMSVGVYLLGISYSVKGIRMKERGIWGLIFSSFAQRNTPVLITFSFLNMRLDHFTCWMLLCFVNGLRYILIHQYQDMENDEKVGIHTYVLDRNVSIKKGIFTFIIIELLALIWLFADEWEVILIAGIVYLGICFLNWRFTEKVLHVSYFYSYACVPMEDLYNVFIPLMLSVVYVVNSGYYLLLVVSILYLIVPFCKKIYMPAMSFWKLVHRNRDD